jgi:hypothetical protein
MTSTKFFFILIHAFILGVINSCSSLPKVAAKRGVDVKIIVPSTSDSTMAVNATRYNSKSGSKDL